MITYIFGKAYAETDKDYIESLFSGGSTCNGYYKRLKKGIYIYNMQHKLVAFVKAPTNGEPAFIVEAYDMPNRKIRYAFGLATDTKQFLDAPDSYTARLENLAALF